MTKRLTRALQRGGVVAQIRPEAWGVWRGRDRRGRMIGTLSGAEIDILRLRGDLKPIGGTESKVLIWAGPPPAPTESAPVSPDLSEGEKTARRSLLESLLLGHRVASERARIRSACQSYFEDLELVLSAGPHTTMNWAAFDSGDRIKSARLLDPLQRTRQQQRAKARLATVQSELNTDDFEFLQKLLRNDMTRGAFARTYRQRPALIDRRALHILRVLLETYRS